MQNNSLSKARRGSARNDNGVRDAQGSSGQDGRNTQTQSQEVGTQGVGLDGRGGEGAWFTSEINKERQSKNKHS